MVVWLYGTQNEGAIIRLGINLNADQIPLLLRSPGRLAIAILTVIGFFLVTQPKTSEANFDVPLINYGEFDLNTLEFVTQPKTVEISVVESNYQREQRIAREQALKARALAKQTVKQPISIVGSASRFAPGNCTWYAATRFPVTWGGNAGQWGINAAAQGYRVNKTPVADALLVTWENSAGCPGCGHVAVIDQIIGDTMVISEMNYAAKYVVSTRTLPINSPLIRAVIHRQ